MMRRRASRSLEILPRLCRDERAGVDQQVYRVRRSPQDLPDGKFSPSRRADGIIEIPYLTDTTVARN